MPGHTLTVTEAGLVFLEDARRCGELCRPLDWTPRSTTQSGAARPSSPTPSAAARTDSGAILRAFVEVDRATMGPERLAAKLPAYERFYRYVPSIPGRRRPSMARSRNWRTGGCTTHCSRDCCSSWTAPDPPASRTG
ncbi:replication-relaxation family protein [Streptomyces mirabilis]|uniref:replication-relaxation family protein n=1 Tax=Streptomyces mirabilis TaxID=68239 RepID=UPI0036A32535